MKNILYFYPDNPSILDQGNNSRANSLLKYFKSRGFRVDLVCECDVSELKSLKEDQLIDNVWQLTKTVLNIQHFIFKILPQKIYRGVLNFISKKRYNTIYDLNKLKKGYLESFENILRNKNYDIVIISYSNWSPLIKNSSKISPNSKLIIDTHDFITSQYQDQPHFDIGYYFKKEIEALKMFDEIWAISIEEHFLFSQFLNDKKVQLVPHGSKFNRINNETKPTIDLLYVASDNPHNVKSINWFFDKVYPLLPETISITIVGKICKVVSDYKNVEKIPYVQNLDSLYENTKISLCPMLSGTGLKIKVVEALSYGIPVVCNQRGVDGLLNKINNGCLSTESENEFADSILKLLSNNSFYVQNKKNAENFFKATLSETIVYKKLDSIFNI